MHIKEGGGGRWLCITLKCAGLIVQPPAAVQMATSVLQLECSLLSQVALLSLGEAAVAFGEGTGTA